MSYIIMADGTNVSTNTKKTLSIRLRPETEELLARLQADTGLGSRTAVVELAINELARVRNVKTTTGENTTKNSR